MGSLASFVYFFTFSANLIHFGNSDRNCGHQAPGIRDVVHNVYLEDFHVIRKRSINQPLRVYKYYDDSVKNLSTEKRDLINNTVIPQAVSYWERTLMLRYSNASIRLNRRCKTDQVFFRANDPHPYCQTACDDKTMCGEVKVPEDHLDVCRVCETTGRNCQAQGSTTGKGITDADFVFYISALQTERCQKGTVVAYAAHCQQEAALDRPIAGHANLCPDSISTKPQELETLISTVKHEMLHALGFSVSLYAFFRDKHGNPLTPRGPNGKPVIGISQDLHEWSTNVSKSFERKDWKVREGSVRRTVQMMVTPRVVEEARKHFACPTLEGAELEDQGGEGTALTHWEKRVFENEAMTGTHTQNPSYSRVTLALMEDTGWYMPNYDMAEELSWGRKLGCDFVTKSCKEWMDMKKSRNENIHPFCDKVKKDPPQTECNARRTSVALCNLVQYTAPLPAVFQNFDAISNITTNLESYGGSVDLADYCPYLQEFTWKQQNVVVRGSQCQYEENNPKLSQNFALEKYGPNSKCFDHGPKMWEERNCGSARVWQHWGSGCYQYSCEAGRLHVEILNHSYICYNKKQVLQIKLLSNDWLHMGSINCPSCEEMCSDTGMKCIADDKASPTASNYYQDNLVCGGAIVKLSPVLKIWNDEDDLPIKPPPSTPTTTKTTPTKPQPIQPLPSLHNPLPPYLPPPILPSPDKPPSGSTPISNGAPATISTKITQLAKIYQVIYFLKTMGVFG